MTSGFLEILNALHDHHAELVIVEESLRARPARTTAEPRTPVRLATAGPGGLRPGIDLDDSASLLDVLDGAE